MALNEAQKRERSEYLEQNLSITECSQHEPYVFISYASDDWETVFKTAVVPMQKQYGMRVYADKAFDRVNDRWIVPMLRNIRGAEVVLAFVSQSYIESYACFLELLTAVNSRRQIVFISLEQTLRLGDTTDQPMLERGAKNEIMNQGANMVTNINNTSNDIMRAMKSAYTSISTLVEQDALSKYDISDAFINFFRDASVNRKTISDLNAVRRTIRSISSRVFDPALITEPVKAASGTAGRNGAGAASVSKKPEQAVQEASGTPEQAALEAAGPPEQGAVQAEVQAAQTPEAQSAGQAEGSFGPAAASESAAQAAGTDRAKPPADFTFDDTAPAGGKKAAGLLKNKGVLCGIAAAAVLVIVLLAVLLTRGGDGDDAIQVAENVETSSESAAQTAEEGEEESTDGAIPEGATYEGDLVNGVPEGTGKMIYANGNVYEGEWKNGLPEGQGKATFADGRVYEGEWKAGKCEGQGKMTHADGDVYEGEWKDGKYEGQGKYTGADGRVYEGEYKADKKEGQGKYTYANGDVYEGEWKADKREGQGKMTYANGDVYEGEWKAGNKEGQGKYTGADGRVYEGEYKAGNKEGQGKYTYANGDVYEGEWKDDKKEGQGKMAYANGDVYEGEWKAGECEGQGKMTYASGNVYEGEWKDGKREGLGILTWGGDNAGWIYEGEYKADRQEGMGTLIMPDGRLQYVGGYLDGKATGLGLYAVGKYEVGYYADKLEGRGIKCSLDGEISEFGMWKAGSLESKIEAQTVETDDGTYQGELSEAGVPEGLGVKRYKSGSMDIGMFHDGKLSFGFCVREGYTYAGELTDGIMTGYAAVLWENGDMTVTDWQKAKRNGFGLQRLSDGTIRKGVWKDDQLVELMSETTETEESTAAAE